jgi:amidophosphoribosyltransferase
MARDAGANKVYMASAAPPVRFPNVYGIDMPTKDELVAHNRTVEQIREIIGCDALIYQDVDAMKSAVLKLAPKAAQNHAPNNHIYLTGFDASCFDGLYVTGDITDGDLMRMRDSRSASGKKAEDEEDSSRLALPNPI